MESSWREIVTDFEVAAVMFLILDIYRCDSDISEIGRHGDQLGVKEGKASSPCLFQLKTQHDVSFKARLAHSLGRTAHTQSHAYDGVPHTYPGALLPIYLDLHVYFHDRDPQREGESVSLISSTRRSIGHFICPDISAELYYGLYHYVMDCINSPLTPRYGHSWQLRYRLNLYHRVLGLRALAHIGATIFGTLP